MTNTDLRKKSSLRRMHFFSGRRLVANRQAGVALFTALMILSILSILGLTMALSANSDMMINGYYGNYRGSFYAADSGMNIARQYLLNNMSASVSANPCVGWGASGASGCTAAPVATTEGATALTALTGAYGSFTSLNSGNAASSWPGSFAIMNTATCTNAVSMAPGSPTVVSTNASGLVTKYSYQFNYTLCATGRAQALQQVATKESGALLMTVAANTSTTTTTTTSFAAFGAFINNYPPCLGALVPGTMTGPMFTNGAWQFMTGGSYIFTDPVGQANANADYWFGGTCVQSPTSSYTKSGQTIKPSFQGGFNLSQPTVGLPPNSFSQKWAVLDGVGCGEGGTTCGGSTAPPSPANSDLNAHLKNISGTSYPTGGAASGVYIPYCTGGASCTTPNTVNGGGFYVEGNASIVLSVGTDASGNKTQIYAITQGATTTTITTNTTANTTQVVSGGTTLNLAGVPENLTNSSSPQAGTMLYVDGTITGLRGTGQGVAAVQDGTQLTITANGSVDITGDIVYAHEPVTENTADSLVSGNDYNQVLGIFTSTGNIQLSSPYSNKNLQVDGSLAAIGSSCASNSCGFTVSGSINTFNNVGGQIQSNIFSANMQTENTYFDRRFTSKPGFAPPWFPSTTIPTVDIVNGLPPVVTQLPAQRLTWVTYPQ